MYFRKSKSGIPSVDKCFDHLISYINRMGRSSGATSQTTTYPITTEGGFYITGTNGMGYKLYKGIWVRASLTSDGTFEIMEMDYPGTSGVIYEDVPAGGSCKVVFSGCADGYFNSNGATRGYGIRMSKSGDTANDDTGKAQAVLISRLDALWLKGYVINSRSGDGITRCFITR